MTCHIVFMSMKYATMTSHIILSVDNIWHSDMSCRPMSKTYNTMTYHILWLLWFSEDAIEKGYEAVAGRHPDRGGCPTCRVSYWEIRENINITFDNFKYALTGFKNCTDTNWSDRQTYGLLIHIKVYAFFVLQVHSHTLEYCRTVVTIYNLSVVQFKIGVKSVLRCGAG